MDEALRDAAWFHELDAWTEYWDLYHPETHGRFYFGDGEQEGGLLTRYLPRRGTPRPFRAWTAHASAPDDERATQSFADEVNVADVAEAVLGVDALLARLFAKYFGDARLAGVRTQYLRAIHRFATDTLPPAPERLDRLDDDDPRRPTAGRHTLDGDMMWFAWALHAEAAHLLVGDAGDADEDKARLSLMMAGVATGSAANFAWRGHRRTRAEYTADEATAELLHSRGCRWAEDFAAASREVHTLYRIREWGEEEADAVLEKV